MLLSFWNEFLDNASKKDGQSSVFFSILKQLKPIEIKEDEVVVACDNNGVKIYLERKTNELDDLLSSFMNKKVKIRFVIQEKKVKREMPLLSFEPTKEDVFSKAGLNLKYRFENFAVSGSNQVAYAAAKAIEQNLGNAYNPLFLYGGVGVGKTHLAQAVARTTLEKNPDKKVLFCPGERFTNELIESIREKNTGKFKRRYRSLDLLIVDDVQFIAGKKTVQEEFFHTFNSIISPGGQIILTSDRHPSEIGDLEDRLRSRFSGGLMVDIQEPDFELRTAILLIKAQEKNIQIDIESAKIISQETPDTRALEGNLLSIYALSLGVKDNIDRSLVESFFKDKERRFIKKSSPADVIRIASSYYGVKQGQIRGESRTGEIAKIRQIVMYILRNEHRLKFEEIARILRRRDHTTIMHGVEKISGLLMKDQNLKTEIDKIIETLGSSA